MKYKPGDYKVTVKCTVVLNVCDLTYDEIAKHGDNVIEWAVNEDFDWSSIEIDEIVSVVERD